MPSNDTLDPPTAAGNALPEPARPVGTYRHTARSKRDTRPGSYALSADAATFTTLLEDRVSL